MSAACNDCGRDIEYPPGSFPLGECSYCRIADERDRYGDALREIAEYPHTSATIAAQFQRIARAALSSEDATRPTSTSGPGCKNHRGDPHNLCEACWELEPDATRPTGDGNGV